MDNDSYGALGCLIVLFIMFLIFLGFMDVVSKWTDTSIPIECDSSHVVVFAKDKKPEWYCAEPPEAYP